MHVLPLRNVVTSVLDNQPDIIILGKFDPSCDIICVRCIDSINGVIAQITLGILRASQGSVDCRTGLNSRVAKAVRVFRQPDVIDPVGADFLTSLDVVAVTLVSWFGDRFVADEFPMNGRVKGVPC